MHPGYVMIDAKPIPGSRKVACIFVPGHTRNEHQGTLTIVDPRNGPDDKSAIECIGWSRIERDPYPVGNKGFLIAKGNEILIMDYQGRTKSIYESEKGVLCQEPRPIASRPREACVPSQTDMSRDTGLLMLQDVNEGRNMKGVKPGQIKELMVIELLPKSQNVSNGAEPIGKGATFNHERILGTVPVEADGSAFFEAPAMRALFLVALDENERAVKRMQSFLNLQPGEVRGCVGCHEERTQQPDSRVGECMAMRRAPSPIKPIEGIPDVFDFPRDIQPILDKYCVDCHGYEKTARGGPRSGNIILTGDHGPVYSHSYSTLVPALCNTGNNLGNNPPYSTGSGAGQLMKYIDGSHHNVKLDPHDRKMVRLWMDSGAIYAGTLAAEGCGMKYFQIGRQAKRFRTTTYSSWFSMQKDWPERVKAAEDVASRRCIGCHAKPIPQFDITKDGKNNWSMLTQLRLNLSRPEKSLLILAPLSDNDGGLQLCYKDRKNPMPVFKDKNDPDYRTLLTYLEALHEALNRNKRFDMPGFRPNPHYVRELKRYGIIPEDFDRLKDPIDVYATDRAYWESFHYKPVHE
jgi:hypothetical protein